MRGRVVIALAALVLFSCSQLDPATAVVVELDAEPPVAALVTSVEVEVLGGPSAAMLTRSLLQPIAAPSFPLLTTIAPRGGDASRAFEYVATARDAGGAEVATVRAVSGFLRGRVLVLRLVLDAACSGVACSASQTCRAGGCVSASVDPATLSDFAGRRDAGSDASRPDGSIDAPGTDATTSDAGPPPCDSTEAPVTTGGVFVSEGGTGDGTSPSSPLGSLSSALPLVNTGRPHIYLAEGTYLGLLDVTAPPAGFVIDGGWIATGGLWRRDCMSGRDATLITSLGPLGMRFTDATAGVALRHLTIETSPPGSTPADVAGGSRISLVVRGAASAVSLFDVRLTARDGEPGGAPSAASPAAVPTCSGRMCSDGAAGVSAGASADGVAADAFTADGYAATDGAQGGVGNAGNHGFAGGVAYTAATNCCGLCNGGGDCGTTCNATADVPTGACGCGGLPGGAGLPGRGGGASVGLLVSGVDATVSASFSLIGSGNGGAGSTGGAAAPPSAPTAGSPGTSECCTTCRIGNPPPCGSGDGCSCFRETCTTHMSAPGTVGGAAGASGAGGGGAGGPSYAIVTVGGARFVTDPTVATQHGAGGSGGGAANGGASGDVLRL